MNTSYYINRVLNKTGETILFSIIDPNKPNFKPTDGHQIENGKAYMLQISIPKSNPTENEFWICQKGTSQWTALSLWEHASNPLSFKETYLKPDAGSPIEKIVPIVNPKNRGDSNVQIVIKVDGSGFLIGELDMDPTPEFNIHSASLIQDSEPAIFYLERGAHVPIKPGHARMIQTRTLPVIKDDQQRKNPGFFPVGLHIANKLTPEVFANYYFYLHRKDASNGAPQLWLKYTKGKGTGAAITYPQPIDLAALRYGSIQIAFQHNAHYDPSTPAHTQEPFFILDVSEPSVPPSEQHIPLAGFSIQEDPSGDKDKRQITVGGRVVTVSKEKLVDDHGTSFEKEKETGLSGMTVILMDHDPLKRKDDYLGKAMTNSHGYFTIQWEAKVHMDGMFDVNPDLYFIVKSGRNTILSTLHERFEDQKARPELFIIKLD